MIEIDLKTAEEIMVNDNIHAILQLDENNLKIGVEFQQFNKNVISFSFNNDSEIRFNFPIEKSFVSSNSNKDLLNTTPFGVSFNSSIETETGLIEFEELRNSLNIWRNWSNRT